MQRLRGSDAFMVYGETPTSPFVTLKVAIYRPTGGGDPPGAAELLPFIRQGVAAVGGSKAGMRILRVPFDIHHPVWVRDPDFSPDNHIFQAELPAPGGKAQLCEFVSDLMSRPLDPERPPWEIWVIHGLEGGRIAVAYKVHHALADGQTIASLIIKAHSVSADRAPADRQPDRGEPIPGSLRLFADALSDLAKSYTVELPRFYRHLQEARRQSAAAREPAGNPSASPAGMPSAPYTIFDFKGELDRRRTYQYLSFPLSRLKAVSRAHDCTLNTLMLCICAEMLRRYLLELGELPAEPMITAMPVGNRGLGDLERVLGSDIQNNRVATTYVPLYQNMADFDQRLQAIQQAATSAVQHLRQEDGSRLDNYFDYLPGPLFRVFNAAMRHQTAKKHRPFANLIISNVRGPGKPLYAMDGRLEMEELMSTGNIMDVSHLNITVWSYVDKLTFSFYSRRDALPRPERMLDHMRDAVTELLERHESAA